LALKSLSYVFLIPTVYPPASFGIEDSTDLQSLNPSDFLGSL